MVTPEQGKRKRTYLILTSHCLILVMFIVVPFGFASEITYPNRAVDMIVPYAPGGGADLGSKIMADKISRFFGQSLMSIYKPGGGGSLAAGLVAKAKPDGYTILVGSQTPIVLSPIVKKLDYKMEDFIPIGSYGKIPIWLVVKADARWRSLKDFVEEAGKFPGKLVICSYGKLTAADFTIQLLSKLAKIKVTHVPYKSTGEALTAVLGGHGDAAIVTGAGGLLDSGSIRLLAVTEKRRLDGLPDVPTFTELGYPIEMNIQYCLCFPKGTPKRFVDTLQQAQERAYKRFEKEIKENLRKVEIWAELLTPEETLRTWKADYDLLYKLASDIGAVAK